MEDINFRYVLEKKDIDNYKLVPLAEKLQWLEDIMIFNEKVLTPKAKKMHELFRNSK